MHSATEVVDPDDMEETADYLENLTGEMENYF